MIYTCIIFRSRVNSKTVLVLKNVMYWSECKKNHETFAVRLTKLQSFVQKLIKSTVHDVYYFLVAVSAKYKYIIL